MKSILFVVHNLSYTGAPLIGIAIAKLLRQQGFSLKLVSIGPGPYLETAQADFPDISIVDCQSKADTERFLRLFMAFQPDLVYINSIAALPIARFLPPGVNTVLHLHEMKSDLKHWRHFVQPEWLDRLARVIAVSEQAKADIHHVLSVPLSKVVVIRNPIDVQRIQASAKAAYEPPRNCLGSPIDPTGLIVSACGTASKRKGTDIFYQLARQNPAVQFLWIGEWENTHNPVLEAAKNESLANFFTSGLRTNPFPLLNISDIFLLTSREDPDPLVVHESISLGKLVIAFSETGGSRYVVSKFGVLLEGAVQAERLHRILKQCIHSNAKLGPGPNLVARYYDYEQLSDNLIQEVAQIA